MENESSDPIEQIVFLKQLVHKLNSALAKFQGKSDQSALDGGTVDVPAPWLVNPQHLSPLLNEYESTLTHFTTQIRRIQDENVERTQKLQDLVEENRQIRRQMEEFKGLIEGEAGDFPQSQSAGMVENLQRQLDLAIAQKDEATKMCRDTIYQLDKLRHDRQLESASVKARLQSYEEIRRQNELLSDANLNLQMTLETVQNEKQALSLALTNQDQEIGKTRLLLKESKTDHQNAKAQSVDSLQKIRTLETELEALRCDHGERHQKEMISKNTTEKLKAALTDAESKLAQALQERTNTQTEINSLKVQIAVFETTVKDLEQKELAAMDQLRENSQMVENAVLARDSALERERKKQEELERIRSTMETIVEEAADRVKSEVTRVKGQCNANIQRIVDEMQAMELDMNNMRSEAERAKRAKRAVEEEFDAYQRQQRETNTGRKMEELQTRMLIAERAKDDALVTVQSLEDKIKRIKIERESDNSSWVAKNESLDRNVKQVKRELDESQHQRLLLMETVNRYKDEIQKLESSTNDVKTDCSKETAWIRAQADRDRKQLQTRVRSLEDSNRNGIQHLHKMLADQQRLSAKWKEECRAATSKYESKISEMQLQLSRTKKRCVDLSNKLKATKQHNAEMSVQMPDLNEINRKLRARLHETEYRLITATERIGDLQGIKTALTLKDLHT